MERNRFEEEVRRMAAGAEVQPSDSVWSSIESELNGQQFEDKLKQALEGAEVAPAGYSWSAIESELIASENVALKGRIMFYQRLAAASVLFAALLGGSSLYYLNENAGQEKQMVVVQNNEPARSAILPAEQESEGKPAAESNDQQQHGGNPASASAQASNDEEARVSNDWNRLAPAGFSFPFKAGSRSYLSNSFLSTSEPTDLLSKNPDTSRVIVKSPLIADAKPEAIELDGLPNYVSNEKKEKYKEDLWAGLSIAAGNYSPSTLQNRGVPAGSVGSRIVSAVNTQSSIGSSYSVGLAMGKRIAGRWVVQGGVNYMNQSQGYTSNTVSSSPSQNSLAFLSNYTIPNQGQVSFTSPYQINNVLQFISVPVQAGYMFIDRKLGLQMNAGVASDFFLRNTLQDPSGQLGSLSQGAGPESPYRSVNFAGLVSTELSVKLARQYRISVVPGFRYMFNPALKAGVNNPYVTDIGFRFRYILR